MKKIFVVLQKIGRALMLPVSALPAAGLLYRFGQPDLLNMPYVAKAGDVIFGNLPMIFAVGVAIGFSNGEAVAALAAVMGELILEGIMKLATDNVVSETALKLASAQNMKIEAFMNTSAYTEIVKNTTIDMGVFGGIVIGIMSAVLYKKFYNIKLPQVLGFFGGKRFIPIITSLAALLFAVIGVAVWINVQDDINVFAAWVSTSNFGPAFYAAGKRLLIPLGLHHMYYPAFLYQIGSYTAYDGITYFGDFPRYFHGDPEAGIFMASEYPVLMFGLPGAALAIIAAAKPENRKKVLGIMVSAAFVSFLTGITEPIEFSFIFVAPILFIFHLLASFTAGIITSMLHIRLGYTFSASFVDYVIGYKFAENPLLIWPVGIVYFLLYFVVFYSFIKALNIATPGREEKADSFVSITNESGLKRAMTILTAVGGKDNVEDLDACITRLRITLKDLKAVDTSMLKETGAAGILQIENSVQIIYGTEAEKIKDEVKAAMNTKYISNDLEDKIDLKTSKKVSVELTSPIKGEIIKLEDTPDQVFAEKILGDGFAVNPQDNKVYAPVDGVIELLFPTKHAIALKTDHGIEILIHVGIETVRLNGDGFTAHVKQGHKVNKGDLLISFDEEILRKKAKSIISPIVVTNMNLVSDIAVKFGKKDCKDVVAIINIK
ncbi:glucose PTS transporter subunit IIA [Clostridium sp. DJ247]|uniref:glucose PTS transporter subunit IIA n=1 Tax=Clostridium sp. DJ247 TaxID=2726188 RepID=UPI001626DD58|nr:glucose PTS transporter subunit IIA [Clostridium sp. DJ247]MBC2581609.1 PTS transporter subunit EIIC [Clostridium sp. DJ247]